MGLQLDSVLMVMVFVASVSIEMKIYTMKKFLTLARSIQDVSENNKHISSMIDRKLIPPDLLPLFFETFCTPVCY